MHRPVPRLARRASRQRERTLVLAAGGVAAIALLCLAARAAAARRMAAPARGARRAEDRRPRLDAPGRARGGRRGRSGGVGGRRRPASRWSCWSIALRARPVSAPRCATRARTVTSGLRLRLEAASFDTLIEWLGQLQERHGVDDRSRELRRHRQSRAGQCQPDARHTRRRVEVTRAASAPQVATPDALDHSRPARGVGVRHRHPARRRPRRVVSSVTASRPMPSEARSGRARAGPRGARRTHRRPAVVATTARALLRGALAGHAVLRTADGRVEADFASCVVGRRATRIGSGPICRSPALNALGVRGARNWRGRIAADLRSSCSTTTGRSPRSVPSTYTISLRRRLATAALGSYRLTFRSRHGNDGL